MTDKTATPDPRDYILTPGELGAEIIGLLEQCRDGMTGVTWGHHGMDSDHLPLWPGSLTSIVARPGHGKTLAMKHLAVREMARIEASGANECVVFVTLEEPAANIGLSILGSRLPFKSYLTGQFDFAGERQKILVQADHPLRIIPSRPVRGGIRGAAGALTAEIALGAIEAVYRSTDAKATLVLIDYLQLLRASGRSFGNEERQAAVSAAAEAAKELALQLGVPVVVGVQASRMVDNRPSNPFPTMADLQWSSSIEQASDFIFGLWRPIRTTFDSGGANASGEVDLGGARVKVNDTLLGIRYLKERGGPGHGTYAASLDPVTLEFSDARPRMNVVASAFRTAEPAEAPSW